jgi:hypothetical protein
MVEVAVVVFQHQAPYPAQHLRGGRAVVLHQMRWPAREEELLGKDTREQVV